jgi:4-amino-4-deoxy-L-arabinose transferase-like glycosyltransferase
MAAPFAERRRPDMAVALIAILSLPLFFYGLGATYLWQDEAQTALLGRSVLAHGVPMVGHGADSLSAVKGKDEGIGGIYFQISWLQAYLAALSFKLFGESSWSARMPFALAGWLCVPLVAWGMRNAGASVLSNRIAALLTALSVPLIICSRQARYYAPTAALTLFATGTYAALSVSVNERDRRTTFASITFGAAASLLVLSFDVAAIGVLCALAIHWLLTAEKGSRWNHSFWIPWAVSGLLLGVWIGLSFTAPSRRETAGLDSLLARVRLGAFYYLGQINAHIVPLPALLTLSLLWRRTTATRNLTDATGNRRSTILLGIVAAGAIGGATLPPDRLFRYAVPVLPIAIGLLAIGLATLWSLGRWSKALAAATLVVLVASNALLVWSHAALSAVARSSGMVTVRDRRVEHRAPLALLVQELRDPPRGPIAATTEYLRRHADAGDVVVATYGDLPLKFHTSLTIYGGETAQLPPDHVKADWIWSRNMHVYENVRPVVEWAREEVSRGGYDRVELPVVDRRWENREDPAEHIFSNPGPAGPPVVLYRLSKAAE